MGKHALRPYAMCCVFVFMADSPNALHALHALVCSNSEESRETTQSPIHLRPSIRPAGAAYGAHGNQRHFSQTIDVATHEFATPPFGKEGALFSEAMDTCFKES